MKKCLLIAAAMVFLSGCGAQETFETIGNAQVQPVSAQAQHVVLELPEDAQVQQTGSDKLYQFEDFAVSVQTLDGGDMDKTLRTATGYGAEQLEPMEIEGPTQKRYHCAWIAAGEGQTQVCRTCIIDDGSFHYVLTIMLPEETAGQLQRTAEEIIASFRVSEEPFEFNTGS